MHPASARIFTEYDASMMNKVRVPGCCKGDAASQSRGLSIVAYTERSISHLQGWQAKLRHLSNVKLMNTADVINFLLQRHFAQDGINAFFHVRRRLLSLCCKKLDRK